MIKDITKDMIDGCFGEGVGREYAIISLYKLLFPEWDLIAYINGWPRVSEPTAEYIYKKFLDMPGGGVPAALLWMNKGFGVSDDKALPDWKADLSDVTVEMTNSTEGGLE